MAKIHTLRISNFRGIRSFEQVFGLSNFVCIIGRGDSGKTTILDAISYVLCGSWNLSIYDTDFYNCNIDEPIEIEVTVYDLPQRLLQESKFGLYIRGIDTTTNTVHDILEDSHIEALTIRLTVERDLEPRWCVTNTRQEDIEIRTSDRVSLNMFFVSEYIDRHFSWSKGSPLYSLLKQEENTSEEYGNPIIDALRDAKSKIDDYSFTQLDSVMSRIQSSAADLGMDIQQANSTIDLKDIYVKEGKVTLHENSIPFRLKGKGSRRLLSIAIQVEVSKSGGGILLIDEIEQGLESDRAQHLAKTLMGSDMGQVFITTHSRDVLVELSAGNLFRMSKGAKSLFQFNASLQAVLRANPEAFFAKKVLVCEGETEVGILRAINSHRIINGKGSASLKGIRFATGKGSNQFSYAEGFLHAGYPVCVFCDSDVQSTKSQKEELAGKGVVVIDCEEGLCIEKQIFNDLPWAGVQELVNAQITIYNGSVVDSIKSRYVTHGELMPNWIEIDDINLRSATGAAASKNKWYKSISNGEELGNICCSYLEQIGDKRLKSIFTDLSNWIENA
jgi:putative ATP-dependent endonuclease of the OLD family